MVLVMAGRGLDHVAGGKNRSREELKNNFRTPRDLTKKQAQ
jgi:hypothetical protein